MLVVTAPRVPILPVTSSTRRTRSAPALAQLGYRGKAMLGGFEYGAREEGLAFESTDGPQRRTVDTLTAPAGAEDCGR